MIIPQDIKLPTNQKERLTVEQAVMVGKGLINGQLDVQYISDVSGGLYGKWVEVRANLTNRGLYCLVFSLGSHNLLQQLLIVLTPCVMSTETNPGGKCYSIDQDGGNPASLFTQEQWQALCRVLVPAKDQLAIRPLWRLELDGKPVNRSMDLGPSPKRLTYPRELDKGAVFEEEAVAQKALQKMTEYWEDALTREKTKPKKNK